MGRFSGVLTSGLPDGVVNAAAGPGVKATGMNIQHPTKQANRPETGVVADKGVPQSDIKHGVVED